MNIGNKDGWTPLHVACQFSTPGRVFILFRINVSTNYVLPNLPSAKLIMKKLKTLTSGIVSTLLEAGANTNLQNSEGLGPEYIH